jgi:hypothetical protein
MPAHRKIWMPRVRIPRPGFFRRRSTFATVLLVAFLGWLPAHAQVALLTRCTYALPGSDNLTISVNGER